MSSTNTKSRTITHLLLPIAILILALLQVSQCIDCNATHYQYFSNFSLGKQQQLNKTFTQLQPLIKMPNIIYHAADSSTFNITDFSFRLRYVDSKQQAIIMGKNHIGIVGGYLQIWAGFKWSKSSMVMTINGTAQVRINSDQIMFQKQLIVDQGYLDWNLSFYYNVSLTNNNFTMVRIDPSTTTASDITQILNAVNGDPAKPQNISLRTGVQSFIKVLYATYLKRNLKNEHYPLDDHFEYTYFNPWSQMNITVPFDFHPTGHDLEPSGLSLTFVSYIKDDPKWKCGKMVPTKELNPQIYGGLQEFISFSVFQNTIRYAFQRGHLNTKLNRNNWQSRFFQFYAGDLYQVIPQIGNRFLATQSVLGNCTFNPQQQITIKRHNESTINTTTVHNCILTIQGIRISEFEVKLTVQVQASANETYLNFHIIHSQGQYNFKLVPDFVMKNPQLAQHMITHSLQRLRQGMTFGSGWKIYPRDYAHVTINDDHVFIYDSTHIGKQQDLNQNPSKSRIVQDLQLERDDKISTA